MSTSKAPADTQAEHAGEEPRWLTDEERDTWLEVATISLQLPGLLDAQLQRDSGLSLFEYLTLSWLSMATDRQMRMGELALLARGSMSRLSNVVKRLESRGFVRREPDPANGRYTLAILTESGWDKVVEAAPGHVAAVRRYVLDPLTGEQVGELQVIGGRIAERIRAGLIGEVSGEADCCE
ncbi:DNA-binding transcriptional regulator, MarR family [Pedococcus dokdonensis]|uniref:DNA-binding transcriptional regulator, MarR family n=1 Tax=Pedococcus dokdonensis TaxID=443156 RepID=A0A1H0UIJ5_9MICO|nr:MarR family winged helix-turn-helix transcriptional regulator [Pedococcus dokdonensis]SDP65999.1 DNA-binding transcriptional regulator, MarR family [Pedococcus dokdonensis]